MKKSKKFSKKEEENRPRQAPELDGTIGSSSIGKRKERKERKEEKKQRLGNGFFQVLLDNSFYFPDLLLEAKLCPVWKMKKGGK